MADNSTKTKNHWWWPFDAHVFVEDMAGCSFEERGVLVTAYNAYYLRRKKDNAIPDNNRVATTLQLSPAIFKKHKSILLDHFIIEDGEWKLPWLDDVVRHAAIVSRKNSRNGRKGADARWHKTDKSIVNDDLYQMNF